MTRYRRRAAVAVALVLSVCLVRNAWGGPPIGAIVFRDPSLINTFSSVSTDPHASGPARLEVGLHQFGLLAVLKNPHLPRRKLGHQGRMGGINTQFSLAPGQHNHIHVVMICSPLRGYNLELQCGHDSKLQS